MITKNENLILGMLPNNVPNLISKTGFAQVTVYRLLANLIRSRLAHKRMIIISGKCHSYEYLIGPQPEIKKIKKVVNKKVIIKNKFVGIEPLVKKPDIIKHHQLMCMFGVNV